ncbi:aldehyde dehydrogenase family protein [Marinovum sp. 2_MG-2023]|uniref:aldehyde dehydrogenase family protein n=1 Tax=unclassified Marinovum TaxID=2647166 RepID=UPI0026E2440A|nr:MULTISPECIES: aldehyde dehydrogenase family protein [unclassified Marinovum]MDO6732564.1 aldehyde dehydrogenase family protein [Marinovum sp. 2_MG-2023]MDO6781804.1 aldehyde dehydrogenase family protein [Marinovum sp. 1_MG-2023]
MDFAPATTLDAQMLIGGQWVAPRPDAVIEVENPADQSFIGTIPDGTVDDAARAVAAAQAAQPAWAARPAIERGRAVRKLASLVSERAEDLAVLITREQGKPISQARGEVGAVVGFLEHAAEGARRIEGDIITSDNPNEEIYIRRHPYGVVVGLTAWNYPAALAARKIGPALVAGNTFVLLAHEITPFSGLFIAALAEQAGIPAGVLNVVTGRGAVVGQALVDHPGTGLITMTGSNRAGREIFRSAADGMKVLRLELGGKAPFIVMEDAEIDKAVAAAVTARYTNCGQICTCNERMYLHQDIADEFLEKFVAASRALSIGDPMTDPDMGPKVSGPEIDKIKSIVDASVAQGAEVLLEGGPLTEGKYAKGHWYAPTVLELKDNSSPVIEQEVFGPVVPAVRVPDFDTALRLANDTEYGLSAYIFTQNHRRLMQTPYRLNFGEIYVNRANGEQFQAFHNGWNHSGLGGEDGKYGFDGYLRKQTLYMNWG